MADVLNVGGLNLRGGAAPKKRRNFDRLLIESIDESLKIMLDESAKRSFITYLEKNRSLKGGEIGRDPEAFSFELERFFGLSASKIEKLIVALLYSKLGLVYEEKGEYSFGDYIRDAREHGIPYTGLRGARLKLDSRDLSIIYSLRDDARKSITQLAKETGLSRPTVTSRLEKMMKQNILRIEAGLNIRELGFPTACIALETRGVGLKQEMERSLSRCPRVLMILRPAEKANLLVFLFGEDQSSLRSTIESLRGFSGASLVDVYHSEPPLFPESFNLRVFVKKGDTAPCGRRCVDCVSYRNDECVGCPAVSAYRGPL